MPMFALEAKTNRIWGKRLTLVNKFVTLAFAVSRQRAERAGLRHDDAVSDGGLRFRRLLQRHQHRRR